jgi:response regulator RpfG family c-di-GMP phosphodiesterase
MPAKILLVDDEATILQVLKRYLRSKFDVTTATSGAEGLDAIRANPNLAVVVSDQRMPGMDGITFLEEVRRVAPETVRIILTADTDLEVAVQAVNRGQVFRFLSKPCDPEQLLGVLGAAVRQRDLERAERDLLQKTLMGSIRLLTELLASANPMAYGRSMRTLPIVRQLAKVLRAEPPWEVEMAAMLSQVGCVAVPGDVVARAYGGQALSRTEAALFGAHPGLAHQLLRNLPRLEAVARIVGYQDRRFDGVNRGTDATWGEALPLGARILKAALDFDTLVQSGKTSGAAIEEMRKRTGCYDPQVLEALADVPHIRLADIPRDVEVKNLAPGMVLAEPAVTRSGAVLLAKGHVVSEATRLGLVQMIETGIEVQEPIRVLDPDTGKDRL